MRPVLTVPAALALLAATSAAANGFHDLATLDRAVVTFTGAAIGQPGGAQAPVDRQLRLAACGQPPAIDRYAADTLRIACPEPGGWRIFVPLHVERVARTEPTAPAIARRDLLRVEAGGAGFRVTRQGEALDEGEVGDSIRVKLADGTYRGRIVTAQVIEPGRVRVPTS